VEGGNDKSALWNWEIRKGWERSAEAARSWDLFEEDLKCLKALGANAYRFSVEWSRLETSPGVFDEKALARYAGWVRRLREEGLVPMVCFHHFSEPAWLLEECPEGWQTEAPVALFTRFVEKTASALGAVDDFLPFNEPNVFALGAYGAGIFPPGRLGHPGRAMANLAKAHIAAAAVLKRLRPHCRVGVAQNVADLTGDEKAAARWDEFMHLDFLDRVVGSLDFLGINYYTQIHVSSVLGFPLPGYAEVAAGLGPLFGLLGGRRGPRQRTGMGWEVAPEGLENVVLKLWRRYKKPILITENGVADETGVDRDAFIRDHCAALSRAMKQGAEVTGYLHWSLVDNWEWGSYKPRFGLFSRHDRAPRRGVEAFKELSHGQDHAARR
jgi:beta-glucosidase